MQFPEEIVKMLFVETLRWDDTKLEYISIKLEYIVINDKWKITPTNDPEKPFKKSRMKLS